MQTIAGFIPINAALPPLAISFEQPLQGVNSTAHTHPKVKPMNALKNPEINTGGVTMT